MRISKLVLYLLKVHLVIHILGVLMYFQVCDPAKQELAGHLRLLVWVGPKLLEAQFWKQNTKITIKVTRPSNVGPFQWK